jgi:prepilin-type N-terminal cleavage/methylation domain-containing protein
MSRLPARAELAEITIARATRANRARRGDTLIEVMAALAIATIGIVGISSMQSTIVRSNQDSSETSVAIGFGRTWLERIKRDALLWNAPDAPAVVRATVVAGRNVSGSNAAYFLPDGNWAVPVPLHNQESAGANGRGIDVGARDFGLPGEPIVTNAAIHYCVNTRFTISETASNGFPAKMTAAVRVWWTRQASLNVTTYTGGILQARAGGCVSYLPTNAELASQDLRVLYLSTPIRFTTNP